MRLILTGTLTLLFFALFSCGGNTTPQGNSAENQENESSSDFPTDTLEGIYTGKLNNKTIVLNIFYAKEGRLTGFNVVSGNRRNVSGTYTVDANGATMILSEPGDDKSDGVFTLTMSKNDLSVISGEWGANSGEVKTVWTKRVSNEENLLGKDFYTWSSPMFVDSTVNIIFEPAGMCYYEYYLNSGQTTEQYKKIEGTFERSGSTVVINWTKDDLFPKKSVFNLINTDEVAYTSDDGNIYIHQLQGMGRTLTEEMIP